MKKIKDKIIVAYYTCLFAFFPLVIGRIAKLKFLIQYGRQWREHHQAWYHRKQADYCRFFLCKSIPKCNVEVVNEEDETFERPAIIIANHQSMLDIPAIFMLHPRIVGMAKEALFRNRMFTSMAKYKELISNATPVRTVLQYARQKLSSGFSFLIFPEGTRSKDLSIQTFHDGAFFFAESLKCDIIPVTIYGTGRILPSEGPIGRSNIVVEVGKRHSYNGMTRKEMAKYWQSYFVDRLASLRSKA